jgi:hypothetical protein
MVKAIFPVIIFISIFPLFLKAQDLPDKNDDQKEVHDENKNYIPPKIETWKLSGYGVFLNKMQLDTLQDEIQIYDPIYKNAITNSFTGNYAGAYLNNDFFSRNYNSDFLFLQTHDAFMLTPKNIVYYNTTTPYTFLDYSQSENRSVKNETRFNVLHSQNINPKLNVTFRFDQARSDGQYDQQSNKNNSISLYTSYLSDKVNFHGGFISNKVENGENGGMKDDNQFFDSFMLFNLVDTRSLYKSGYFYASTEYKHGKYSDSTNVDKFGNLIYNPRLGISHYFEYSYNLRKFAEDKVNRDFFPHIYIDSISTNDSVRFVKLTNIFQIEQFEAANKKASFGKRAYIGFDLVNTLLPGDTANFFKKDNYSDFYIGGGIFRTLGKFWNWNFDGRLYFTGYHAGQTELSGVISKPLVFFRDSTFMMEIRGKLENRVADYFQDKYFSNHFFWDNSFNNQQSMVAGIRFVSIERKFELGANYDLINNFIYNDTLGIPVQTKKELLILSAFLNKKIEIGKFTVNTKLLAQKPSSKDLIHLPEFSAYLGMYYKLIISKVMFAQIGADTRYNTKYYADAFSPATGFFYLQNEKMLGNYPYVDVYASLKLKRTRAYFKLINVGSKFLDDGCFTSLHYPMNKMTFRLGVDWKFFD